MLTAAVLALGLAAVPGAVHAQPPRTGGIDTDLLEAELGDFASLGDHTVLVEVREAVTGNTLGHELEARVFEPAGLDRTYFPQGETSGLHGPHLTPYLTTGDPEEPSTGSRGPTVSRRCPRP